MSRRPYVIGETAMDLVPGCAPRVLERFATLHDFDYQGLTFCVPTNPWPVSRVRAKARALYHEALAGREVVFLGRRVARAFVGLSPHFDALHAAEFFASVCPTVPAAHGRWDTCRIWLVPNPQSPWWADRANTSRARAFFAAILGRTEAPQRPALPAVQPAADWWPLAETRSWPRE